MVIGGRLKAIRQMKSLTQGDIEKRTGLLRCYLSRVENGHTVPSLDTLEKLARAFGIPLYQIFFDGSGRPKKATPAEPYGMPKLPKRDRILMSEIANMIGELTAKEKQLVVSLARKFATGEQK